MKVEEVNGFWGGRMPIMRLMCDLRKGTAKTAQTCLVPVTVCTKRSLLLCPQACLDALATCKCNAFCNEKDDKSMFLLFDIFCVRVQDRALYVLP
jgi:hypothetical protein